MRTTCATPQHSITGFGLISAAGLGVTDTRRRFFADSAVPSPALDSESRYLKISPQEAWLRRFDLPSDFFIPNLFALLAVEEALESAGLTRADLTKLRVGVILGSTAGCSNYHDGFAEEYARDQKPTPEPLLTFFRTNTAQFISRYYGLRGPISMLNNACTSGADAVGVAADWLDENLCDVVICGGVETVIERIYFGFRSLMLCSPVPCKPFDKSRQGLTLGDGAGILILEKSNTPRPTQALFLGYGSGSDAFHPTSPHPEARGLNLAVQSALRRSNLKFDDIDFVNAHGTGTPHNDLTEGRWISRHTPRARLVATKGYTGHTLGAAGGIEAILTILSLQEGRLPISKGFEIIDSEIGLAPTLEIESGEYTKALSFSLGFGGTNSVLCLGRVR